MLREPIIFGKEAEQINLDKYRMVTVEGFARYLRCTVNQLKNYAKKGGDWEEVFEFIKDSIYSITIEQAGAGLIKEGIATRKLGLADKVEVSNVQRKVVMLYETEESRAVQIQAPTEVEDAEVVDTLTATVTVSVPSFEYSEVLKEKQ